MSEVTHIRLIFPLGFDVKHMIKTFWDEGEQAHCGAVLHHNVYWKDNVSDPNFAVGMEVHVGVEREPERDIFGTLIPCAAAGIMRGEYVRFDPWLPLGSMASGGWGWLVFRLRYDMQEGPENWDLHKSGYQVYSAGQAPNFYWAAERKDND